MIWMWTDRLIDRFCVEVQVWDSEVQIPRVQTEHPEQRSKRESKPSDWQSVADISGNAGDPAEHRQKGR